jgi:hypothetical protein
LAEGEELSSNPLRRLFNELQTTLNAVDVAWRILSLAWLYRSHHHCANRLEPPIACFRIDAANIGPNRFHQNRLMADIDATLEEQIFDLTQRERKANVYHHLRRITSGVVLK